MKICHEKYLHLKNNFKAIKQKLIRNKHECVSIIYAQVILVTFTVYIHKHMIYFLLLLL